MGKVTFFLAFSLVAFLAIQTALGNVVDVENPDQLSGLSLDELSATAENFARSAGDALEGVMESSPSWTDWAREKFDDLGFNDWLSSLTSPAPDLAPLAAPVSAPVSARKIAPHYAPGPSPTSATDLASDLPPKSADLASNLAMEPAAADAPALAPRA